MNTLEMSNEFDVLYNNIMSNLAPGIDEYEKSVLLTKALYEILKAYFEPRGNKYIQGFDGSEQRQMDFSRITKTVNLEYANLSPSEKFDMRSKVYYYPEDCFIIINEQVFDCNNNENLSQGFSIYTVQPITYQKYAAEMTKPYKYPPKNILWRLITGRTNIENSKTVSPPPVDPHKDGTYCEIIGKFSRVYADNEAPIYKMRYLRKPNPIILINLEDDYQGLTIENQTGPSECELPDDMHHTIVLRAVELAAASYDPLKANILTSIGNVSSTNLGVIPQSKND